MLLGQMLSMMLMILMGFAAVKTKLVKSSQSSVISALTLYIIVPCVVIDSFQIEFSAEKMKGGLLLAWIAINARCMCCLLLFMRVSGKEMEHESY